MFKKGQKATVTIGGKTYNVTINNEVKPFSKMSIPEGVFVQLDSIKPSMGLLIDTHVDKDDGDEMSYIFGYRIGKISMDWWNSNAVNHSEFELVKIPVEDAKVGNFYFDGELFDENDNLDNEDDIKYIINYYLCIDDDVFIKYDKDEFTPIPIDYCCEMDISSSCSDYLWEVREVK
jgi:hypothetical protein